MKLKLILATLAFLLTMSGVTSAPQEDAASPTEPTTAVVEQTPTPTAKTATEAVEVVEESNSEKEIVGEDIDAPTSEESAPAEQPSNTRQLTVTATAYCPCVYCCGQWGNLTATGTSPTVGRTIAVDPNVIPLGSTVLINGQAYIAEDTGGVVKGNRIDIFFGSHAEALNFGRQILTVEVCG